MCSIGAIIGLGLGVMQAQAQKETSEQNQKMIADDARMKNAAADREYLVESRASQKEAHKAWLEQQSSKGKMIAMGNGAMGNTAGARVGEQMRQGSLSIQNAKDREEASGVNRMGNQMANSVAAQNRINIEASKASPMSLAATVIGSGASMHGSFGGGGMGGFGGTGGATGGSGLSYYGGWNK